MNGYNTPTSTKNVWSAKMIAVVSSIAVLSVALIAGLVITIATGTFSPKDTSDEIAKAAPPILIITECPDNVTSNNISARAEGYIVSDNGPCTLRINGQVVAATQKAGEQAKWSKTFTVLSNNHRLDFVVEDINGNKTEETREISYQALNNVVKYVQKPIVAGCSLRKKKAGGLNISEYAGTYYDVIDFISANDYSSSMTYTGYSVVSYDGYVWYQIISPRGKRGYVRSDLVANYQYY